LSGTDLRWSREPAGTHRFALLMSDLAAVGIAAACFAFIYLLLYVLERV
jgi:hypothetical protein